MPSITDGKYQLKSLHEEIDLFDRKLSHLLKYEAFDTDSARAAAAKKMTAKRELLVKNARRMASEGVEFHKTDLPRSFRTEETPSEVTEAPQSTSAPLATGEVPALQMREVPKPMPTYAGTSLDWQRSIDQYLQKKGKR